MARTRFLLLVAALVAALALVASPTPAGAEGSDAPGAPASFRSITAGEFFSCAIRATGTVACWGRNSQGQLGQGDTDNRGGAPGQMGAGLAPIALGTGRTATTVGAGTNHACALLDDGTVKCWGRNTEGQLGLGDTLDRGDGPGEMGDALPAVALGTGRTATAISTGGSHTCALLDNGTVKCWGAGASGVLGLGAIDNRGDGTGEMGDNLPAVALGTSRTATAISTGGSHTCALLDNSTVKCWGLGTLGRLGYGSTTSRGDGTGEMGDDLPAVALGTSRTATAISTGGSHTCALLDNGTVKCWGGNTTGALGLGDISSRGGGTGQMGDALPAVALGSGRTADGISAGPLYSCALLDDATVKCWGAGSSGRLGVGDTANRGDGAGEMGDALAAVALGTGRSATAVTTGGGQACALLDDAGLRCWGANSFGELGIGSNQARGDGAGEMGDALPAVDLDGPVGPGAGMVVQMVVDQTTVAVGQPIDFHITVTNAGSVPLTGVAVTDPEVPDCERAIAAIPVGGQDTVDCSHLATADDVGTFSNTASVDSDQTDPASTGPVEVTVDLFQPDALIRVGSGPFRGDGSYNTTAVSQGRSAVVGPQGRAVFTVQVQNDGTAFDDVGVRGLGSTNRFVVTYQRGATNITSAVVAGTFTLVDVPPSGSRNITVRIQARAGAPVNATVARKLTLTGATTGSQDAAKVTVTRR